MSFNTNARVSSLEAVTTNALNLKADKYSPYFEAPLTVTDSSNNTIAYIDSTGIIFNSAVTMTSTLSAPISIQQKKYVDDSISTLIDGAPTTLDSLRELAAALGNDKDLASHLLTSISGINNLINLNTTTNTTIVNTNSQLKVGQYNSANGVVNPFLTVDQNNISLFNGLVVNSSTGVQTSSSLYNRNSIDNLL